MIFYCAASIKMGSLDWQDRSEVVEAGILQMIRSSHVTTDKKARQIACLDSAVFCDVLC